jgi:hypothetical protein
MTSLQDRLDVQDLIAQYVYGMDTGDAEYVTSLFVPGAECIDVTGKRWDQNAGGVAGFAKHFLITPHKRAGQHYFQIVNFERVEEVTYRVRSFWSLYIWKNGENELPLLRMLGLYTHTVTRANDRWLISHMKIEPWRAGDEAEV